MSGAFGTLAFGSGSFGKSIPLPIDFSEPGDVAIVWDPTTGSGDIVMSGGDLLTGHALETAVIISLFTDARADPGDIVLDTDDRRGWWADTYAALEDPTLPTIGGDRIGSKLWQAFARIRNQDTLNWAANEAQRALAWMVTDGVAQSVTATAYFTSQGGIGVRPVITRPDGSTYRYDYAWAQEH
jgi:phage gp46-like protein